MFYNLLPERQKWYEKALSPAEFLVDETFGVPGVGTVVAGTLKKGVITTNANLMLGPDVGDGSFKLTSVKSIHYKRLPVTKVLESPRLLSSVWLPSSLMGPFSIAVDNTCRLQVVAGQTAALALKRVKRGQVRKGMVLVDERLHPKSTWEFEAEIAILTHSTTIQPRYQVGLSVSWQDVFCFC
jgi:GTPase